MQNKTYIDSDGINVYLRLEIHPSKTGKRILTICNCLLLAIYFSIVFLFVKAEDTSFIFPLIIMFVVFVILPWRYWFWNIMGKEFYVINKKTITRHFDYGLIHTAPKTVFHNQMASYYELNRIIDGIEYGNLFFVTYPPDTLIPEIIFRTSIMVSESDLQTIQKEISKTLNPDKALEEFIFSAN